MLMVDDSPHFLLKKVLKEMSLLFIYIFRDCRQAITLRQEKNDHKPFTSTRKLPILNLSLFHGK